MKKEEFVFEIGIVAWTILLCFFFIVNCQERLAISFIIGKRAFQASLTLAIFVLAGAIGSRLLKIARFPTQSLVLDWVFGTGIGLAILGYLVFFLGLTGLFNQWIYILILIAFFIIGYPQIRELMHCLYQKTQTPQMKISPLNLCLVSFLCLASLCYLIGAFAPEVGYDGLEYHLGALTTYLADGRIHFLKNNVYANFPALGEMLYLLGMILEGDTTAKLINYGFGLLCVLAIIYFGRRYFSWTVGLVAASIFYIYPQTGIISAQVYIDLAVTFFTFLGLWSVINWFEDNASNRNKWLVLAGVYGGLACSCKYTSLLLTLTVMVILVIVVAAGTKIPWQSLLWAVGCLVGLSMLVSSPWYIKNYISTGNPFYPLFYKIFGGHNWDLARDLRFWKAHIPPEKNLQTLIQLPWYMVTRNNTASLLFIFFIPVFVFIRQKSKIIVFLSLFTVIFYLAWFYFTHQVDRFFIPALPALSLICGYTLDRLKEKKCTSRLLKLVLIGGLVFNIYVFNVIIASINPWTVALGWETEEEFLERNMAIYRAIKFLNDNLQETDKVLFIGEARVHYLKVPFLANTVFDKNIINEIINDSVDIEQIKQRLSSLGITHVLVNMVEVKRLRQTYNYMQDFNWKLFSEFERSALRKIYADPKHGISIYEINFGASYSP